MGKGKAIAFLIIGAILVIVGIVLMSDWSAGAAVQATYDAAKALCGTNTLCLQIVEATYGAAVGALMGYLIGGIICLALGAVFIILGIKALKS